MQSRRGFLMGSMFAGAGCLVASNVAAKGVPAKKSAVKDNPLIYPMRPMKAQLSRELTVAIVGAGGRGWGYQGYGKRFPGTMKVVAVADLLPFRRERMARAWKIPAERCFCDYRELLAASEKGKLADILMVTLPDHLHRDATIKGMELGYDVLVEKPMAQSSKECLDMLAKQKETGRIVGVCHVLRYAPYYEAIKSAIDRGLVGEIMSIQHTELVDMIHTSHSYVRGNWRNSKIATPMVISKCCHDLDLVNWFIGARCTHVSAEGELRYFIPKNRPAGTPARCTDGCPHEKDCIYSALKTYVRQRRWTVPLDLPPNATDEQVTKILAASPYSRCVFACDNDQPEQYAAALRFENGVSVAFSYEALSRVGQRRTRIIGTKGMIEGDGISFRLTELATGKNWDWNVEIQDIPGYKAQGHGGGDFRLVRDFLMAVDKHDPSQLTSSLEASVESHLIGFACEESRLTGKKIRLHG